MNSLTVGFIYTLGLGWVFAEAVGAASYGNSVPLYLTSLFILVFFVRLGCLPSTEEQDGKTGAAFAMILGVAMLYFALTAWFHIEVPTFPSPSIAVAITKTLAALFFLASGILAVVGRSDSEAH